MLCCEHDEPSDAVKGEFLHQLNDYLRLRFMKIIPFMVRFRKFFWSCTETINMTRRRELVNEYDLTCRTFLNDEALYSILKHNLHDVSLLGCCAV